MISGLSSLTINISAVNDLSEIHHPNIIALTETLINTSSIPSELANTASSGYTLLSYPSTSKQFHL